MKLILASNNAHKLREFKQILSPLGIEIISQSEAGCHFEVDETGTTFEENAYLKAVAVTEKTGLPAVADDSGLEVDALGGAPGIYSARYTGNHEDTDEDRLNLVLKNLGDNPQRSARFVSCISCTFPNGDRIDTRGECEGTIAFAPMGEGGFGYDPVFFLPQLKKTFAQLSAEEKNAISHRGKALELFRAKLENYLNQSQNPKE